MSVSVAGPMALIGAAIGVGLALVMWFFYQVSRIAVDPTKRKRPSTGAIELEEKLVEDPELTKNSWVNRTSAQKVWECYLCIYNGAHTFLHAEYLVFALYSLAFVTVIVVLRGALTNWADGIFAGVGFIVGAGTSMTAGYLGMKIAVYTNARTAIEAQKSLAGAFNTAFRGGAVMGFTIVTLALSMFSFTVYLFSLYYVMGEDATHEGIAYASKQFGIEMLFKAITGFGVGAASFAMFSRVGGGIYTKAADVGADLVGKVEAGIPEDDPRNPATIADNVGDNVGDIAGMGADLFSSMIGSMVAALVLSGEIDEFNPVKNTTAAGAALPDGQQRDGDTDWTALMFPMCLHAAGIICCGIASLVTYVFPVDKKEKIIKALKVQEMISTVLIAGCSIPVTFMCLPADGFEFRGLKVSCWDVVGCVQMGIWGGLLIGLVTEYYTAYNHAPVQEVAASCKTGAATNIISGLSLGYYSTMVPIIMLAGLVFAAQFLAGIYGIAIATVGILCCLGTSLSIDAYGPICDNAGGIAEMSDLGEETRDRTDALDAAGNTTAAIGKGFAIASACLVGLALIGAFTRSVSDWKSQHARVQSMFNNIDDVDGETAPGWDNIAYRKATYEWAGVEHTGEEWEAIIPAMGTEARILDPLLFAGLLIGAMLPYIFTAMTMKSVGKAALKMVEEVRKQFRENPGIMDGTDKPDYEKCIAISTQASLREMVAPASLVILTPIIVGFLIGTRFLTGVLVGALLAGIQFAIAQSNTGGAWDNAKKYIEAGYDPKLGGKGSDDHKAAVIGDTVGDPLKDTSGPAINVLIKNMGLIAVLFVEAMKSAEQTDTLYNPAGVVGLSGQAAKLTWVPGTS